ncbi:MAG TPA: hypothetical protein VF220_05375 [Nitrososphaeraceae archaeon]
MTNYGYRDKYRDLIHDMYTDGRKEVIQTILSFLKEELAYDKSRLNMRLDKALDTMDYGIGASIHDSVYCMPYHECIVILEYLTDHSSEIDNKLMNPNNDPNNPHEQMDNSDLTSHLTEVMRNWIYNGICSMFYTQTDQNKTVKQNIAKLEKDHKDVLN